MKFIVMHEYIYNCQEIKEISPSLHGEGVAFHFYDGGMVEFSSFPGMRQTIIDFLAGNEKLLNLDNLFAFSEWNKQKPQMAELEY